MITCYYVTSNYRCLCLVVNLNMHGKCIGYTTRNNITFYSFEHIIVQPIIIYTSIRYNVNWLKNYSRPFFNIILWTVGHGNITCDLITSECSFKKNAIKTYIGQIIKYGYLMKLLIVWIKTFNYLFIYINFFFCWKWNQIGDIIIIFLTLNYMHFKYTH